MTSSTLQPMAGTATPPRNDTRGLPPVILLGGMANALSVARRLGRLGVQVYALADAGAFVVHSRFCRRLDVPCPATGDEGRVWSEFLLGSAASALRGAVLLACSDTGLAMIAGQREALAERYLLDESNPRAQLRMLNKLETYQDAVASNVPTPRFWLAGSRDEIDGLDDLTFPLVVKPRLSHVFEGQTGRKLLLAHDVDTLASAVSAIAATGTESLIVERIPGPDDLLCSYYTYLDADGRPLFHFTKRIIRRYPVLSGTACYHITDWIPEAAELANRLFRQTGLRGLANVEFKRDRRDGQLKLIECNARFTASNSLVARSGFDLAAFVYQRLNARPQPTLEHYKLGLRLWDPIRDFQAYRELSQSGELTLGRWLSSVLHTQTFPYFEWTDPLPALARLMKPLRKRLGKGERQ